MEEIQKITALKSLDEIKEIDGSMEISVPTRCDPDASYTLENLVFKDNGVLILEGNLDLKVERVYNYKDEVSLCDYEFIIAGNDGIDAEKSDENGCDAEAAGNLNFDFGTLNGDIRIKTSAGRGGKGFDGINGMNGGCGGDGYCGGNGGDGGNAVGGTDGGKGGDASNISIVYKQIKKGSSIYVNGEKVTRHRGISLKGGTGGKGGKSAEGGKGGQGGKGIDMDHSGRRGLDGLPAPAGKDGENGADGTVKIQRKRINEILDNLRGMYILDLSDEEEREYCLNKLGGSEFLKKYEAVTEAINQSSLQSEDEKNPPIKIELQDSISSYLTESELAEVSVGSSDYSINTKYGTFIQTFSIDLYDTDNPIADEKAASKWKIINVQVNSVNTSYATGYPIISQNFETTDTYGGIVEFGSEILEANLMEGKIVTDVEIKGIDGNGKFVYAKYGGEVNTAPEMKYTVQNIEVRDPKWNRKSDDGIIMLYGRTNEQKIYDKADYSGGDYLSNTVKPDNKVATLMPFSGTVTFGSEYRPVGLTPPGGKIKFLRPAIDYSSKAAEKKEPDVAYQNDLNDMKLYELLTDQKCFKAVQRVADPHVDFDFSLNRGDGTSKLDWHHDISGEMNNRERLVFLRGNFSYRILRNEFPKEHPNDVQIGVLSITKENLEEINNDNRKKKVKREYYKFLEGSNIIYIPPIHIYWGCLGKSVLLKTDSGTLKTAETVKIGDRLLSHAGKAVTVDNVFTGHDKTIYRLCCSGFETLMTGAHPVLGENGKGIAVSNLRAGDRIMTENGGMTEVLSVREEPYNDTVYSFTFEGEKESVYFIADGIFVGDLNAQNQAPEEPQENEEQKEKSLKLIGEMHSLLEEIRSRD